MAMTALSVVSTAHAADEANAANAADAVDTAYIQGNDAYARGNYEEAAANFEQALHLLGEPNAVLAYNLGTTYAQLKSWGRATFFLEQAQRSNTDTSAELRDATRTNADIVRERVELAAAASQATLDRAPSWWARLRDAFGTTGLGIAALVSGWLFVALALGAALLRSRFNDTGTVIRMVLPILGLVYVMLGGIYAYDLHDNDAAPKAIVMDERVDVREGPGQHRPSLFRAVGGTRVRIVQTRPGWREIRLPQGLTGWVPQDSVVRLDRARALLTPRGDDALSEPSTRAPTGPTSAAKRAR